MKSAFIVLATVFAVMVLSGCTSQAQSAGNTINQTGGALQNVSSGANMAKNPTVVFETTKGTFKAEIFEQEAPITAKNFLGLVRSGFYDNLTFHRFVSGFVIQGGDPNGDGSGGSDKPIPLEIVPGLKHDIGALSMARTDDPNSASSQFFVVVGEAHFLDGQYAVFGKVTEGMDNVQKLRKGDRMTKVYVQ